MHTLQEHYLNIVYQNSKGHDPLQQKKTITETYGEILYPSIAKLLSQIKLNEQDVFFDLGSGLGKVVCQVFLTTKVKAANGIEIIPNLHYQAEKVEQKIRDDFSELYTTRNMRFILGNFLEISFATASIILLGSPLFSPLMLQKLGMLINNTPSIHTVLTLRPIFNLKYLRFKKAVRVECSWDSALCYIYKKQKENKK